jgi:hypothetical protein
MKKVSKVLLTIFSIGVIATLFAGALAFLGYVVALIIGGETATALCAFIYKQYFPWVIRVCSVAVGFGLVGMYFDKKKALVMNVTESEEE